MLPRGKKQSASFWLKAGRRVAAIGLHARRLGPALALGAGLTAAAFVVAGAAQVLTLESGAALVVRAVDPKTGLAGGVAFAALLILGNVINSFMEEGLFRGIMLTHFLQRWRFGVANLLQAALFTAWYLVWPLKSYTAGDVSAAVAGASAAADHSGIAVYVPLAAIQNRKLPSCVRVAPSPGTAT